METVTQVTEDHSFILSTHMAAYVHNSSPRLSSSACPYMQAEHSHKEKEKERGLGSLGLAPHFSSQVVQTQGPVKGGEGTQAGHTWQAGQASPRSQPQSLPQWPTKGG